MAVNQASIATHVPQSLPSFAQAFSTTSLGSISSGNNSLPPIQSHLTSMEHRHVNSPSGVPLTRTGSEDSTDARTTSRKRPRIDAASSSRDDDHSNSDGSPRLIQIKEEQDHDMLDPSPPPHTQAAPHDPTVDTSAPAPSELLVSPAKRRRVTVSGAPHPLNTDVRVPVDQTNSTPISPVVMGFTIKRDNPSAIEQVRSMITVKQKQKALIEQRRGSVAGVVSPQASGNPVSSLTAEERNLTSTKPPASARPLRRSPNTAASCRRPAGSQTPGNPRPPSPSPIIVPSQQSLQVPNLQSLAPPPISFARRRAGQLGVKKKPADIVISPREAQTREQLQPGIQSAPPIPHAGQGSFHSGRAPMALPRLPVMGGGDSIRRVASNVPPTPTRLSLQRNTGSSVASQPISSIANRSPPTASVPISSTLVPPTPIALQHGEYPGDKPAFLAPFEMFYDALNDSKQLKHWLEGQLQRSSTLMQSLTQQQERMNEVVESLVEKRVAPIRSEMAELHRRVEELEDALRAATSGRTDNSGTKPGAKPALRNGIPVGPTAPESYAFPPTPSAESSRHRPRPSSPGWGHDREPREAQGAIDSDRGSPAPFDSTRISMSSSRLDPPRSQPSEPPSQSRTTFAMPSPPQGYRDSPNHSLPPSSKPPQGGHVEHERPGLSRRHSSQSAASGEHTGSPTFRRGDSRRGSITVPNSDTPREDT